MNEPEVSRNISSTSVPRYPPDCIWKQRNLLIFHPHDIGGEFSLWTIYILRTQSEYLRILDRASKWKNLGRLVLDTVDPGDWTMIPLDFFCEGLDMDLFSFPFFVRKICPDNSSNSSLYCPELGPIPILELVSVAMRMRLVCHFRHLPLLVLGRKTIMMDSLQETQIFGAFQWEDCRTARSRTLQRPKRYSHLKSHGSRS